MRSRAWGSVSESALDFSGLDWNRIQAGLSFHKNETWPSQNGSMISVASSLLLTLQGAITRRAADKPSLSDRLEEIRQAMLDNLEEAGDVSFSQMERRVLFAPDAESLWYLRPELLMVIATLRGERAARQILEQISVMFTGLLPKGLNSRPAGLSR